MRTLFRKQILLIGFIYAISFSIQSVCAQSLPLVFKHLTVNDGLSSQTSNVIYQDKMGFIWFGTDNGLNKYNGFNIAVYQHNASDSLSISSNNIVDIFEDSFGDFWIGHFYTGLDRFDRESEIFKSYQHEPDKKGSISSNYILCIFEDSQKNLWVGTGGGGLNRYNRESDSFIPVQDDSLHPIDIGSNYISSIKEDKNGCLWIGSTEGILLKYDLKTNKSEKFILYADPPKTPGLNVYGMIYIDSENNVWFGTENGLYVYDQNKNSFRHFTEGKTDKELSSNMVTSMLELEDDIYLIGTYYDGLNIYNKNKDIFTTHTSSEIIETTISNNRIQSIYRSPDGIIWIGTFKGGINILDFRANKFQQYKNLVNQTDYFKVTKNVKSICEDTDKNIWIGTDGEGINVIDPKTNTIQSFSPENNSQNTISGDIINEIVKEKNGDLWIGYYMDGMSHYNKETNQFYHYRYTPLKPNGLGGNNVWAMTTDTNGIFWIGVSGNGLNKYDKTTNTFTLYSNHPDDPESLSNNMVSKVFVDNLNQVWVGTLASGLNLLDKNTGKFIRFQQGDDTTGVIGDYIHDIYQDQDGNLWIGTEAALNLYHPQRKSFEHFSEKEGLKKDPVAAITSDKKGNLWISTTHGISKFDVKNRKFHNYDAADGLQDIEFINKSVLNASDDKIYFGGMNGFIVFHPDSIRENQRKPPVYITNLNILHKQISPRDNNPVLSKHINYEKRIVLTYKQSSEISFEFAALNYSNSQKNQYAYWLEGFDEEWKFIGNKHEVTYTNLNPGKYLFKVKASNNDGIWNEKGTSLEIVILPPWWETFWFRTLTAICILSILIGLYYFRVRQLRSQKKNLEEKVFERTNELNEANASLEEKHEELTQQNELLSELSDKVIRQNKELEMHYSRLEEIVKERTMDLEKAKNKAEESDKLKSAFLANMSHEIRTPMNAIVGFSSLLKNENLSRSDKLNYIEIINTNSEDLLVLINDILDLSLIEANQLKVYRDTVNLNEFLDNIFSYFSVINTNEKLEIKINNELHDQNIKINSDRTRLKQILSNLMNNALKFTEKGSIELGLRLENKHLLIYVKDTGIGIDKNETETIFKRFGKIDIAKNKLYRGAGLGLSISKSLAHLLGGNLTISSDLGKGSIFTLVFPDTIINHEKIDLSEIETEKNNDIRLTGNNNILVVEDEEANYLYIEKLLSKIDMQIHWAKNGKEAVNFVSSDIKFSLVIMDIKMPVMDGFEATKIIKSKFPELQILALTAYARPEDYKRFITAGFNDYITKPVKPEDFYEILKKFLNEKRA